MSTAVNETVSGAVPDVGVAVREVPLEEVTITVADALADPPAPVHVSV